VGEAAFTIARKCRRPPAARKSIRSFITCICVICSGLSSLFCQPTLVGSGYADPTNIQVSPGQITTFFVSGLALDPTKPLKATSVPLPYSLGGVSVEITQSSPAHSFAVPLLAVQQMRCISGGGVPTRLRRRSCTRRRYARHSLFSCKGGRRSGDLRFWARTNNPDRSNRGDNRAKRREVGERACYGPVRFPHECWTLIPCRPGRYRVAPDCSRRSICRPHTGSGGLVSNQRNDSGIGAFASSLLWSGCRGRGR